MSNPTQLILSWVALLGICSYFVKSLHRRSKRVEEHWWGNGKFNVKVDSLVDNGQRSNPQNYQQQLPGFVMAASGSNIYQVPGKYDGTLSPRIIPSGLSAQVMYNLPSVSQMALEPSNPLSIAKCVQTPAAATVEPFDYKPFSPSGEAQTEALQLKNDGSVIASSTLPVPSMVRAHQEQTSNLPTNTPTVSYDRFIVANLNRLRGHGDWIRGDLFINPILPNTDANSPIWFRPSNGTEALNTGAMAVLGGAFNDTNRQTCNLVMHGNGGSISTQSGLLWAPPAGTSVGAQIAENALNMATSQSSGTTSFGDVAVNSYPSYPSTNVSTYL